jgi:hypothetical protein
VGLYHETSLGDHEKGQQRLWELLYPVRIMRWRGYVT